jgi:hypothetical protein
MTRTLLSYCKTENNTRLLEFGQGPEYFNGTRCSSVYRAAIKKQLTNSVEISLEQYNSDTVQPISEFKLTNQGLVTWDDHWISKKSSLIVDPKIVTMNLQRNSLVYVNINTPRLELKNLNLEGNVSLEHLYIHEAPALERLDISNCRGLRHIALGINRDIKYLSANNCAMESGVMEQLLRDFTPVHCSSANNSGIGAFRKQYDTEIDLRGNVIDWGNPRIASKIRMLLVNNWIVRWDNNPPSEIIPPQLYAFFVESKVE